ncbi:hypothetical protein Ciccas_000875 [Cichlidogyrus casuarinus]|uniref:Uncharacterized protein n=1 Tax=Cichlidogyrus casuarinus TaxID=1844966 RepID=A0ABD2QLR6_9PLAT
MDIATENLETKSGILSSDDSGHPQVTIDSIDEPPLSPSRESKGDKNTRSWSCKRLFGGFKHNSSSQKMESLSPNHADDKNNNLCSKKTANHVGLTFTPSPLAVVTPGEDPQNSPCPSSSRGDSPASYVSTHEPNTTNNPSISAPGTPAKSGETEETPQHFPTAEELAATAMAACTISSHSHGPLGWL